MSGMAEIVFFFSVGGALLVMMALGIALSALISASDRWSKRYFIALFSLLFLCSLICYLAMIFWYDPDKAAVERVVYFFESVSLSSLMVLPTVFLLHYCGENAWRSVLTKTVSALWSVYFVMLVAAQFTDAFYYVTPDNQYFRGSLFPLLMSPLIVIMFLNIAGTIRRREKLSRQYFLALLVYLIPMTAALLVHMFYSVEIVIVFCMALFALLMYALIISDNVRQNLRQQREIANQRASVMVLQMRPHFISNTMVTIYHLCAQDPEKARQVTLDFTNYLRRNFSAIASEDTVPFADELRHTQAYLAVEQAMHEDSLFVEFDTPHTFFRVPPLTLQPLVENAVKHAMDPNGNPLHIFVKTAQTASGSEIIVENDGADFIPADDNEPHIALKNIRERLRILCGGKLTIAPRSGGGTVVKVTIPPVSQRQMAERAQRQIDGRQNR